MVSKPFAPACERNQAPILQQLKKILLGTESILEIGSGTGQHAVYFAKHLPNIHWQTSDVITNHPGIHLWLEEANLPNIAPPIALDINDNPMPPVSYDVIYTANTFHIMSWPTVLKLINGITSVLQSSGKFICYGPFKINSVFTSSSNEEFDKKLRRGDPKKGIREIEAVTQAFSQIALKLEELIEMPANNCLLVYSKV